MDYYQTLERWESLKKSIQRLQLEEKALRQGLFDGTFPNPIEGTNKKELEDGRVLKGVFKINRKVSDQEGVFRLPKAQRDLMFRTKVDLKTAEYKKLDDEARKAVDVYLTATPGLPTLDLIAAKPSPEGVAP